MTANLSDDLAQAVTELVGEAVLVRVIDEDTRLTAFVKVPALGIAFEVIGNEGNLLLLVQERISRHPMYAALA